MTEFTYYFINRPPFIGTHPKENLAMQKAWSPTKQVGERHFHGWATYTETLSFEQIWKYELYPADPDELRAYNEWRDENDK